MSNKYISRLAMSNIRCFQHESLVIRPLTLLVGENSTGKSTSLASVQTVLETLARPIHSSWRAFNQNPHALGKFRHIVRNFITEHDNEILQKKHLILKHETNDHICTMRFSQDPTTLNARLDNISTRSSKNEQTSSLQIKFYDGEKVTLGFGKKYNDIVIKTPRLYFYGTDLRGFLENKILSLSKLERFPGDTSKTPRDVIRSVVNQVIGNFPNIEIVSSPPVRVPAQRSYNYSEYNPDRMGIKFPMVLFELSRDNRSLWEKLRAELIEEGIAHDLFSDFFIRTYDGLAKRFEILTKRDGVEVNICDLGAGIWQVFQPLIIFKLASILDKKRLFLFQQPDEHAHPRLQSHMASLFCRGIDQGHRFIVETHSDYILNALSTKIKKKDLDPAHVGISFFVHDQKNNCCRIYNREFNNNGQIKNVPRFFKKLYATDVRGFVNLSKLRLLNID